MRLALPFLVVGLACAAPARADAIFADWRHVTEAAGAAQAGAVSFIVQEGGGTSLYRAEAPGYLPQLVDRADMSEPPLSGLAMSADGMTVSFSRHGAIAFARRGEPVCTLGSGAVGALSPDGEKLAVTGSAGVVLYRLNAPCASVLAGARVLSDRPAIGPLWSSDSQTLAFEEPQGRARQIALFGLSTGLRRLDNHGALDVAPAFSPDGRRIAFLRLDPGTDAVASLTDEDPPTRFHLMRADLMLAELQTLWTSPGLDSFARQWRSRTTAPVVWLDDQRLLFLSEHAGWLHLYLRTVDGVLRDLHPGRCEVDGFALAPPKEVVVSDNCDGLDRRRLRRITLNTGGAAPLSPIEGVAAFPQTFNRGQSLLALEDDGGGVNLRLIDAQGARFILAPNRPAPPPQSVTLAAQDGLPLTGQVRRPTGGAVLHPAVIFLHGGPQRQMLAGAPPQSFYARWGRIEDRLARQGFVVLALNYRGGLGQGRDFRRAAGAGRAGASELQDVLAAQAYLARQPDVDPHRLGLIGDSWGGWLAALALATHSDLFKAGVVAAGVYDLSETGYGPSLAPAEKAMARDASAAGHIDGWRAPVLIIHGDQDRTVPFSQAVEMAGALRARKVEVEFQVLQGSAHAPRTQNDWETAGQATVDFLTRQLKP